MAMLISRSRLSRLYYLRILNIRKFCVESIVSEEKIEEYQQNGVVCLRNVFDKKWLDLVARGISKNIAEPSIYCDMLVDEDGKGMFFNDYFNFDRIPEYHDYVTSSPAAEIAGHLMKCNRSIFFHEHVFFKEKGSTRETPWHHDFTYYPLNGFQNCSIWMPTAHVRKESSVKFIKGSHRWSQCFIPKTFEAHTNYAVCDESLMEGMSDINTFLDGINEDDIVQYELQPGDCIAFHMRCVHGTEKSDTSEDRCIMVTRWLGEDMTFARRPWKASPPSELLPGNLKSGDHLANNGGFLVPWER